MANTSSSSTQNAPDPSPHQDDAPLDPAMERVRLKLRRLILVSGTTVLVGFLAVLFAVMYKIAPDRSKSALPTGAEDVAIANVLPEGARIVSTALDGSLLALTIEVSGATRIVVVDVGTGAVVRRIELAP
ncbi:hypothetical protein [Kaistia adipata]|uniref:hypothetical protein n=1 Tax=Kaistia adipata TaxID=166954 RepID=UPI0004282882|nr:hypothetical protein [Kaistia adipata]